MPGTNRAFAHTAHQLTLQAVALKEFRHQIAAANNLDDVHAALDARIADYETRLAVNASVGFALMGATA